MRVVIAKKLLSTVGGSEAQARALARALAKRHHDVTLVGLRPAWRRPGIPLDVYAAPPGPVELRHEGVRFVFLPFAVDASARRWTGSCRPRSWPARISNTPSREYTSFIRSRA